MTTNRRTFLAGTLSSVLRAEDLSLTETLKQGMERAKVPGAAVAVFRRGKAVEKVCSGLRKSGEPDIVVPITLFEAASLSKPVFATSVMKLWSRKGINLDQPLMEYLGGPYVHIQEPWNPRSAQDTLSDPRAVKLTPRLVLSHRTGLPNWAYGSKLAFRREPGVAWGYSGEGFVILQQVIENITGLGLEAFVRREVLDPLKLTQSRWSWDAAVSGNVASGHSEKGLVKERIGQAGPNAAASLMTNLDEYSRFLEAALAERSELLPPEAQLEMLKPASTADEGLGIRWGLGWGLVQESGRTFVFHWGSNEGYRNFFLLSSKERDGFLMFSNSDHGMKLVPALCESILGVRPRFLSWGYL
ncbi:MAG: beta-lactamase family protein [Bryobacteraceae bacterium]|nr:beta-lactamase family protein [Bryobacteraceae bacterium]